MKAWNIVEPIQSAKSLLGLLWTFTFHFRSKEMIGTQNWQMRVCVCAFCFLRELSCLMLHLTYLSTVFLLPSLFTSFTIQSLVPHVCAIFYFLPSSSLYLSFINLIPHSHLLVISVLSFGFILSLSTDGRILHIPFCNWTFVKSSLEVEYITTL